MAAKPGGKQPTQSRVGLGKGLCPCPEKTEIFILKRHVLAHFERAGVEIALMQQPTVLACTYCYKPILLPKLVNM